MNNSDEYIHSYFDWWVLQPSIAVLTWIIIIIIIYSFRVFHISVSWWFFKSPQVSRIRLRILAVLSNAVVWIVSTRPPTSKSSRPFNNPLVIGTIVTFMFHSFFNSLVRSRYLSFFSHSFIFILWSAGTAKSTILQILFFFLLIIISSGLLAGYYHYHYYYYLTPLRVFPTSISRWFLTGVWVFSSRQDSPQNSGRSY